ncbi:TonB-dependent siderophore receptor [Acetobacter vaccinii]|uniref:TonB-dependent receptor n=1 Tax=Acetobacter vaccinii TaxID=2592655 RepID=A0A5C1YR19_9PROT|nr:TonB-dependent receptor [Acetobacter vaccinii]QEO18183.1 TonB-dependent receptor [Acetobacter vaccinii]
MLWKDQLLSRSFGLFAFAGLVTCVPEGSLIAASADHLPKIKKENRKSVAKTDLKAKEAATVSRSAENVVVHSGGVGRALNAAVNDGALGRRSVFDTPFSVVSVGAAAIQARQATDINAVFAQDSSVTIANSGSGAASGASFKIRGLAVDSLNGYKVDGLAIPYWSIDLPVENFESIQMIKGASAFMYGFGAPGGVVNFEIKKPHDLSTLSLEAGYRSDAVFRQMIDAGGTLIDRERLRYRFSFSNEIGNLFNGGTMRRDGVTLAFDGKITSSLKWDASMFFMKTLQENMINTLSIASTVTSLPSVSGRTQLGARGSWKTNDMKVVTAGLTWEINQNWHSRLSYRYSVLDEDFPGTIMTMTNNQGDYHDNAFFIQRQWWYNQIQEVTEGHVDTGPFRHDIVAGVSWEHQLYDTDANATTNTVISTGNIFNDIPSLSGHTPADFYHPRLYHYIDYQQIAPFLSDTVTWHNWSLLAGFRYTWYSENDFSPTGARTASHRNTPITPVFALTYKVDPGLNVYFSYVQAMQSGGQAGSSNVNRNEVFAPMESSNYELGIKIARKKWSLTGALFRLDSGTGYTNAQNYYMQDGLARYQGVEINGAFAVTPRLTVSGGITYLSARYQKAASAIIGNHVEGTAPLQASAQLHYRVPRVEGLSLDAYFRYVDSMYDGAANTLSLPSYRVWDIGANYALPVGKHHLTFRGMIRNLGGQRYWTTYGNMAALPGDPRTVSLSARIDF